MHFARDVSRILAYRHPVDMRKSFTGLVGLVQNALQEDPLSGTLYVFSNRRRNYVKGVFWDRTGFCLLAKRLESGKFILPSAAEKCELSEAAFRLLLDGIMLGEGRCTLYK